MAKAPNTAHGDDRAFKGETALCDSGAAALIFLRAVKMKTAIRAKKAPIPRKAMSMLRSDWVRVAAVTTAPAAKTPPVSRTCEPSQGPTVVPSELKACDRFRRLEAPLGLPSSATSGLAATCSRVTPEAMTNRAIRTPGYQSAAVAAGTIRQPATMTIRAPMIERL